MSIKETDQQRIQRYYLRFRKAQAAIKTIQDKWTELDTFDRGEQWKDANIPPWVPKPTTNLIRHIRTLKRANLASAIPRPNFSPINYEHSEHVAKLQKAHDHVWETEHLDRTIRECIDRAQLQGTSVAYVYNDDTFYGGNYYGENDPRNQLYQGKICVKRFPITNFFPDVDAYELDKCKYVEITQMMTLKEIKNNPVFRDFVTEKYGSTEMLDQINTSQLEYEKGVNGTIFDREYTPEQNLQRIQGDEMVTVHIHWERFMTKEGRWQVDCTWYLRNSNFFLFRVENLPINVYPFAILYDEKEENDIFGTSIAMQILENQKIINKLDQTISIIGVLHQNPQKVVSRESGINAQELARTGTLPGKVWTTNGNPSDAIHYSQPPELPVGIMQLKERMVNDIKEMAGINEAYSGDSVGSLTTSTGVNSLIERATIRDKDKMVQIDAFVERISHLIVLNILHLWKDARPITTTGINGVPQYDTYEPIDQITADNLEWIVKSDVYARAPVTQASKRQQADALMQLQGQFNFSPPIITPEEWIQFQDFDIKEEILYRMQQDRQRMEAEKADNVAAKIEEIVGQAIEAIKQGLPQDQVNQTIAQLAQEYVTQDQADALKNGRPRDVQATPDAPQGTTGQLAMQAMAKGN